MKDFPALENLILFQFGSKISIFRNHVKQGAGQLVTGPEIQMAGLKCRNKRIHWDKKRYLSPLNWVPPKITNAAKINYNVKYIMSHVREPGPFHPVNFMLFL